MLLQRSGSLSLRDKKSKYSRLMTCASSASLVIGIPRRVTVEIEREAKRGPGKIFCATNVNVHRQQAAAA